MMFSGNFAGAASQQLDTSLQAWRQLWLADQKMQKDEELARSQQEFDKLRLQQERELNEASISAANTRQLEEIKARQQSEIFQKFTSLDPWQQVQQVSTFSSPLFEGTDYEAWAKNVTAGGLFNDPQAAYKFLQEAVYSPDAVGTVQPLEFVKQAIKAVGATMDPEALKDFTSYTLDVANKNSQGAEQIRDATFQSHLDTLNLAGATYREKEASTAQSNAQTTYYGALTNDINTRLGFDGEEHGLRMGLLAEQLTAARETNDFNKKMNPLLIEAATLDNDGKVLDLDIRNATRDAVIEQMLNEAELSGYKRDVAKIEALNAWTNAQLDLAAKRQNLELGRQTLETGLLDQENLRARTDLTIAQKDELISNQQEARISTITNLVSLGMSELLGEYAGKYLKDIVGEENVAAVTQQLQDIAKNKNDEQDAAIRANIAISNWQAEHAPEAAAAQLREAEAQADLAEFQAGNAQAEFNLKKWSTEQGVYQNQQQIDSKKAEIARAAAAQGTTPPTLSSAINQVQNSTGINRQDLLRYQQDYKDADAAATTYGNLLNVALSGSMGAIEANNQLIDKFGMDAQALSAIRDQDPTQLPWEMAKQNRRNTLEGAIFSLSQGVFDLTGTRIIPTDLGLPYDMPEFNSAMEADPYFRNASEDAGAAIDVAIGVNAYKTIGVAPPELTASTLWTNLVANFGESYLKDKGITIDNVASRIGEIQAEFNEKQNQANQVANTITVGQLNLADAADRQSLRNILQGYSSALDSMKGMSSQGYQGTQRAYGLYADIASKLGIQPVQFNSLNARSPREVAAYAASMEQINSIISTTLNNLQWLDQRMQFSQDFSSILQQGH